jgi:hypothetical protein
MRKLVVALFIAGGTLAGLTPDAVAHGAIPHCH